VGSWAAGLGMAALSCFYPIYFNPHRGKLSNMVDGWLGVSVPLRGIEGV
jgi:hypothetical protein